MKYLSVLLLFILMSPCFSQSTYVAHPIGIDIATKKYTTSGVVQIDSIPARTLMEAAYKWLSEIKYVNSSASKGIITDEAAFNRLQVNQYFFGTYNTKIRFIVYLEFRDGRYKYTFTDFSFFQTTARTDFEEVISREDTSRLLLHLKDANNYVSQWVNECNDYLKAYAPDESW